jgi:hypothetical protein
MYALGIGNLKALNILKVNGAALDAKASKIAPLLTPVKLSC